MTVAIKIENLSKQYRLGLVTTRTLRHDLNRWCQINIHGKEDPYLKIGEVNDRSSKGQSEYVWALRNINLELERGEILGIIGKNGAGKSTLLKILSKITTPTTGTVQVRGRIASLLEVGTGFHPEMTGRENIFMNGVILGMTKHEINAKLDEIIDFSGVERYIDTPVKRYSSGMMVRLGFAVAAHLNPEILVVDEVLAVGDAEFQKKAIGKMQNISKSEERTVLFVSHNLIAIQHLCRSICILHNGYIKFIGDLNKGIELYQKDNLIFLDNDRAKMKISKLPLDEDFNLIDLIIKQDGNETNNFYTNKPLEIVFSYEILKEINGIRIGFDLINGSSGVVIFRAYHDDNLQVLNSMVPGDYESHAIIPRDLLLEGDYVISISIGIHNVKWIIHDIVKLPFRLFNINGINKFYADNRPGVISPHVAWVNNKIH